MSVEMIVRENVLDRKNERFAADWANVIPGELILATEDQPRSFEAVLADMSLSGCAVRCKLPHGLKARVAVLRIKSSDNHVTSDIAGRVCWIRKTSVSASTLGLVFRRRISEEFLNEMITNGLVSRRDQPRECIDVAVQLRRTAGKPLVGQAMLLDRSLSGVQLLTEQPLEPEERILLTVPDGHCGAVSVVWSKLGHRGWETGARFQNRTSSDWINSAVLG